MKEDTNAVPQFLAQISYDEHLTHFLYTLMHLPGVKLVKQLHNSFVLEFTEDATDGQITSATMYMLTGAPLK